MDYLYYKLSRMLYRAGAWCAKRSIYGLSIDDMIDAVFNENSRELIKKE